jgi:hypothetical protein
MAAMRGNGALRNGPKWTFIAAMYRKTREWAGPLQSQRNSKAALLIDNSRTICMLYICKEKQARILCA